MSAKGKDTSGKYYWLIAIVCILAIFFVWSSQSSNYTQENSKYSPQPTKSYIQTSSGNWSLFYYSSVSPSSNYLIERSDNIRSKEICLDQGIALTKNGGSYECAYNCKYNSDYQTEICDRTCDHGGCRE